MNMKKDEKDSEFENKIKEMGWREINRTDRPAITLKDETKDRITIYLDSEIVAHYKQTAKESGIGYQTLINRALRQTVQTANVLPEHIKEGLLNDNEFLQNLKSAILK